MTGTAASAPGDARAFPSNRWWQLIIGVICMSMIANLQYGWTLFVNPMNEKFQWGKASIQIAFTIFGSDFFEKVFIVGNSSF